MAKEKKEMKIRPQTNSIMYEVFFENGGEVPQILKGSYTSPDFAQKAIDSYLATRDKVTKRGTSEG